MHQHQNQQRETFLLWDSSYSTERRRSFLFGTVDNLDALQLAPHLLLDGTFKTSPNLFTQLVTIHGLFDDGWRMPLAYGLLPGKTQHHYEALLAEIASFGVEHQGSVSDECENDVLYTDKLNVSI